MKQKILNHRAVLLIILTVITQTLYATKSINQDLDVGTVSGAHAVNLSGAFTYTIPIKIPEGTMGVQPNLSLNYNNQSGNGIAGYGWNLSGLSAISRVNKSIYYDDEVGDPELTYEDALALDGNRIFYKATLDDGKYRAYYSEIETFQRILTANDENLTNFTVETKDGKSIEYGHSNNSKLLTDEGVALMWYINKVTDRNGNFMTYHYDDDLDNQVVLERIEYTGNGTTKPHTKVFFNYSNRTDKSHAYIAGSKVENYKLLQSIEIRTNCNTQITDGQHLKSYQLLYEEDRFNYLTKFREWAIELKDEEEMTDDEKTKRLNSLTFEYDSKTNYKPENYSVTKATATTSLYAGLAKRDIVILPGNFDGDGLQDFLTLEYEKSSNTGKYIGVALQLNNNKNNSTGFTTLDISNKIVNPSSNYSLMYYLARAQNLKTFNSNLSQPIVGIQVFTGDVNGDNIDDIIIYDHDITTYRFFESTGIGEYVLNEKEVKVSDNSTATLIDVDGDSLLELFIVERAGGGVNDRNELHLQSFDSRYDLNCYSYGDVSLNPNEINLNPKDYDGDGKMELEIVQNKTALGTIRHLFVFKPDLRNQTNPDLCDFILSGTFNFSQQYTTWGDYRNNPMHFKSLLSDFNGDGKDDELILNEINKRVELKFNTTLNSQELGVHNIPYFARPENKLYSADLNADGLTDCFYTKDGGVNDEIAFYINQGEGKSFQEYIYTWNNGLIDKDQDIVQLADFDGDGAIEIFFKRPAYGNPVIFNLNFGKAKDRLLTTVYDSYANQTTVDYLPLSAEKNYSFLPESEANLIYPFRKISAPIQVVHKVNTSTNTTTKGVKEYTYKNLTVHLKGKGMLGFEKVTETDRLNKIKTESIYSLNPNQVMMLPDKSSTYIFDYDPDIKDIPVTENSSIYIFQYNSLVKNYRMYVDQTINTDHTNQSKTITQYKNYDDDGNPRESITQIHDLKNTAFPVRYTTTETIAYKDCDWWASYLPEEITTTLNRKDYTLTKNNKRIVQYTYNDATGNLETETTDPYDPENPDINNQIVTSYTNYDIFGNAKTIKIDANGETERSSTFVFDKTGRFVEEQKNSNGDIVETIVINQIWGAPQSITDINGNKTSFTYDNYGRLHTTTDFLLNISTTTYDWEKSESAIATGYNIPRIYKVTNDIPNVPETITYFDQFGRAVLSSTQQFNKDELVYAFKKYDKRGRLTDESGSFEIEEEGEDKVKPTLNKYSYDDLNRMKTSVVKQYTSTNGLTPNITEEINYTYPVRMVEIEGTLPAADTDIMSKTTTYDATGKVISVQDPGGYLYYTYNNFNELNLVKTVKDDVETILTNSLYDDFGRQTTLIDANAGTTTYDYNPFDELISQTDAKGNTTSIIYDNLGRIDTKTLTDADGIAIDYVYTYYEANVDGRLQLQSESGPNNYSTTYTYDGNGRLLDKTDNIGTTSLTTSQTYNSYSDIETITYPGKFTVTYHYDENKTGAMYKATSGNTTIYEMTATNHLGQITDYQYSNGSIPVEHSFNELGMPTGIKTKDSYLFAWSFNFNKTNGNLNSRTETTKENTFKTENFGYDHLHRLTNAGNSGVTSYYDNGNIKTKNGAGTYAYKQSQGKINAVTSITNENENIALLTEQITYSAFDRPTFIREDENRYLLNYGAQHQRLKTILTSAGQETTRYYSGNYELLDKDGRQTSIYYLSFANSVDAIYVKEGDKAGEFYYTFTDYLGSILKVVGDDGFVYEKQSFDAWGRKRNPDNWTEVYETPTDAKPKVLSWLNRGYTGHEHLYEFGLINMNNRLYDPIVGRMLAVDNFVGDSESTQAFNRYSYALNNPLKFVDPSGEFAHLIVGAAIGGLVNWAMNGAQFNLQGLGFFAVGALGGALGAGVGAGISSALAAGGTFGAGFIGSQAAWQATSSFLSGALIGAGGGFAGGFVNGFGNSLINGGSLGNSFGTGLKAGLISGIGGAAVGGLIGGSHAKLNGRNFWTGQTTREVYLSSYGPNVPIKTFKRIEARVLNGEANSGEISWYEHALKRMQHSGSTDSAYEIKLRMNEIYRDIKGNATISHRGYMHDGTTVSVYDKSKLKLSFDQSEWKWTTNSISNVNKLSISHSSINGPGIDYVNVFSNTNQQVTAVVPIEFRIRAQWFSPIFR